MRQLPSFLLRRAGPACALVIILVLFVANHLGDYPGDIPSDVKTRFRFERFPLPEVPGPEVRYQRKKIHPSLRRIPAFISSVGAAVALNDIDGNGLSDDVVYIDTRTDQVVVACVPGTPERYLPFALDQRGILDRERMAPLAVAVGDFNEDGWADILVLYAGRSPMFFLRRGDVPIGPDAFSPCPLIKPDRVMVSTAATLADLDGDGHVDLILGNYFSDGSDILNAKGTGTVQLPHSQSHARNGGGIHVFRWVSAQSGKAPSVTFEEVSDALPQSVRGGWTLALAAQDLDGDLLPEIYIANDFGPDKLLHNVSTPGHIKFSLLEGQRSFSTPWRKVLGRDSYKSMGVDFGDLNGDGLPDIYVSAMTSKYGGYESQQAFINTGDRFAFDRGVAPFQDLSEPMGLSRTGWAWEAKLGDFDNDGDLEAVQAVGFIQGRTNRWPELQELAMVNDACSYIADWSWPNLKVGDDVSGHERNPFFVRVGKHFVNISEQIGFGEESVSRGIATGDADGDGRLDMVVANMWGPSTYYHNLSASGMAYLGLHIYRKAEGQGSQVVVLPGRHLHPDAFAAVGAAVQVRRADGKVLIGQVDGGNGFTGKRSPDLLFGLANNRAQADVTIKWLDKSGPQSAKIHLMPGWYTIYLGSSPSPDGFFSKP